MDNVSTWCDWCDATVTHDACPVAAQFHLAQLAERRARRTEQLNTLARQHRCLNCKRTLTDPASIAALVGPECAGKVSNFVAAFISDRTPVEVVEETPAPAAQDVDPETAALEEQLVLLRVEESMPELLGFGCFEDFQEWLAGIGEQIQQVEEELSRRAGGTPTQADHLLACGIEWEVTR